MAGSLLQADLDDLLGPSSPLDAPIPTTWFPHVTASDVRLESMSLRTLAARARTISARPASDDDAAKKTLPLVKLARFGDSATRDGALRHDANVLGISGIELDYDNEPGVEIDIAPEEAARRLRAAGVAALVMTTPTHQRRGHGDRWRVFAPLSREHAPEERAALVARLNGALLHPLARLEPAERARHEAAHPDHPIPPAHVGARESFALSQSFFVGRLADAPAIEIFEVDGDWLDSLAPNLPEAWEPPTTGRRRRAAVGPAAPDDLMREAKRGADESSIRDDLASGRLASALRHAATLGRQEYHDPEWQTPIMALAFGTPDDLAEEVWGLILTEFVERSTRMARWAADGKPEAVRRQARMIWRKARWRDVDDPTTLSGFYGLVRDGGWSWQTSSRAAAVALLDDIEGRGDHGEEDGQAQETGPRKSALESISEAASEQDPLSDRHLALRFSRSEAGREFLWSPELGNLCWVGSHWAQNSAAEAIAKSGLHGFLAAVGAEVMESATAEATRIIAAVRGEREIDLSMEISAPGEEMLSEAQKKALAEAEKEADKVLTAARKASAALQSASKRDQVWSCYRLLPAVVRPIEVFDRHPHLIATPGGTVDMRAPRARLALRPADPDDLITRCTAVTPRFDQEPTKFLAFLREIFPQDATGAVRDFIRRWSGYSATGEVREQKFLVAQGVGRNGKGTWLTLLGDLLGDYAKGIPVESLLDDGPAKHRAPLARLRAARMVRTSEPNEGQTWNDGLIKSLSGRDPIPVNHMRGETFDLVPEFKLVVDVNPLPHLRTTGPAIRARVLLLHFPVSYWDLDNGPCPEGFLPMDKGLPDALRAESAALMGWVLGGAADWYATGLNVPSSMVEAAKNYIDDQEPLLEFVNDCLVLERDARVANSVLYPAYRAWAEAQGLTKTYTAKTLNKVLCDRHGLSRFVVSGSRGIQGARLKCDTDAFEEYADDLSDLL